MTERSLAVLILLNLILLAGLVVLMSSPEPAVAQFGASNQYLMISGAVTGRSNQDCVYIIDLQTSQMVATVFNSSNEKIEYIASTNISQDAARSVSRKR